MTAQPTYVFVVCKGKRNEGADPTFVAASLNGAFTQALRAYGVVPQRVFDDDLTFTTAPVGEHWMAPFGEDDPVDGCDEVWIHRMEVRGK